VTIWRLFWVDFYFDSGLSTALNRARYLTGVMKHSRELDAAREWIEKEMVAKLEAVGSAFTRGSDTLMCAVERWEAGSGSVDRINAVLASVLGGASRE